MKNWILLFSFLVWSSSLLAQESLTVLATKGQVKANGKVLKTRDKLNCSDKITYTSTADMLYLMSSKRGRLILNASKAKRSDKGELWAMVSNEVQPARGRLSTRQGLPTNDLELISFFSCSDSLSQGNFLIIDEGEYLLPQGAFPQNDQAFFYIRYNLEGEEVNKKLDFEGEILFINKDIYKVDGKTIGEEEAEEMKVCYYYINEKTGKHESKYFIPFQPVFKSGDELKEEVEIILKNAQLIYGKSKKDSEAVFNEIYTYLNEMYGKPTNANLEKWLKKAFDFEVSRK